MKRFSKIMLSLTLATTIVVPGFGIQAKAEENTAKDDQVSTVAADATTGNKRIVTYFPSWGVYEAGQQYVKVKDIAWDKVTHVNHGFFEITSSYDIQTTDSWADYEDEANCPENPNGSVKGHFGAYEYYKKKYPNVKILISVGGWTRSDKFSDAALTDTSRQTLANNMVAFMKKYSFIDGMDIDWEYPCITRSPEDQYDRGCVGRPEDKENFTLLLKTMRETFDANGMSDKLVTCAVSAGEEKIRNTEPDKYQQYCDYIGVMTYDFAGSWDTTTGHLAPLYQNPNDPLSKSSRKNFSTDYAMKLYSEEYGVQKDKLLAGVPLYSRGWGNVAPGPNGDGLFQTGGNFKGNLGEGGQYSYYDIPTLEKTAGWTKYRDEIALVPYLYNASLKQFITYEDDISLKARCNYVNKNNYGGVIVWDASGDILNGNVMHTIMYEGLREGKIFDVVDTPTYQAEDVNKDCVVDLQDLASVGQRYRAKKGDLNYDASCDVNSDGVIDIVDIVKVATKIADVVEPEEPTYPDDTYDSTKVYNSGDTVVYKGVTYKAQWWTQGDEPGNSSVWVEVN